MPYALYFQGQFQTYLFELSKSLGIYMHYIIGTYTRGAWCPEAGGNLQNAVA